MKTKYIYSDRNGIHAKIPIQYIDELKYCCTKMDNLNNYGYVHINHKNEIYFNFYNYGKQELRMSLCYEIINYCPYCGKKIKIIK